MIAGALWGLLILSSFFLLLHIASRCVGTSFRPDSLTAVWFVFAAVVGALIGS